MTDSPPPRQVPVGAFDRDFDAGDLPGWMDRLFPILFIGLGVIASVGIASEPIDHSPAYAVALVAVAVSPWALSLVGIRLVDPVFATIVIVPIGVLIVFGESLGIVSLDDGGPQLVMMLLIGITGQIGTVGTLRLVRVTTIATLGLVVAGAIVRGSPFDYMPWIVGILLGVGGGRAFRANVAHVAQLRVAHEALAQQALADERRRIAREVHDIVAHTMSVTMLHLTAARLAVRRDPDAAEAALAEAERHGRASMDDIRGVVRLLRTDEGAVTPALPDDDDLPDLVSRYTTAGSEVSLRMDGPMSTLAPALRLAVYRVVQESLSNAVRHGGDPVGVVVAVDSDAVEIEVSNPVRAEQRHPVDAGSGITGMRERVEALGGRLGAGPDGSTSQWRVHARIPT